MPEVKISAADRLYSALLTEMASGNYHAGKRFLSHRQIMSRWRASATTANRALHRLVEGGVLEAVDRSGHYLCADFLTNALLALNHLNAQKNIEPSPSKKIDWRTSIITGHAEHKPLTHIAVIVILPRFLLQPGAHNEGILSKCIATLLTVRGIFKAAEEIDAFSSFADQPASQSAKQPTPQSSEQASPPAERPRPAAPVSIRIHINDGEPQTEQRCMKEVLASKPQGVIIVRRIAPYLVASMANTLLQHLIPVVTLYDDCENTDMLSVNFNNIGCGYNAAKTLIQHGHRNLAVLMMADEYADKTNQRNSNDRLDGFAQCVKKHDACKVTGIGVKPTEAGRKQALGRLLKSGASAIFSVGEEPMCHLITAFNSRQLSIPEDFSVIICSSTPHVRNYNKPVDIVYLDFEGLGRRAFQALYDFYHGHTPQKHILTNPIIQKSGSIRRLRCKRLNNTTTATKAT